MTDPYSILGIDRDATEEEIKKAYRRLSRKYHPDANINNPHKDEAEAKFKEVQQAYTVKPVMARLEATARLEAMVRLVPVTDRRAQGAPGRVKRMPISGQRQTTYGAGIMRRRSMSWPGSRTEARSGIFTVLRLIPERETM